MSAIFLRKEDLLAVHHRLIDESGGSHGILNEGALESAIAAVENRVYYEDADVAACAATYGWHLTQAHAFIDGNKRVGAAALEIFLEANGWTLDASDDEMYDLIMSIADGSCARDAAETWLRPRLRRNA
jgi:death-on-curing protein